MTKTPIPPAKYFTSPNHLSRDSAQETVAEQQMTWFARGGSGCAFAAMAAKNPLRYGWKQFVLDEFQPASLARIATEAIADPDAAMASFIFPTVTSIDGVRELADVLATTPPFFSEAVVTFQGATCLPVRLAVGTKVSWVTGFGPFHEFPTTRRAPFTSVVFRAKDRPNYKQVMKKSPDHVLHLADLDFLGDLTWAAFQTFWHTSIRKTAALLGHKPDLRSAAKTTFSFPS